MKVFRGAVICLAATFTLVGSSVATAQPAAPAVNAPPPGSAYWNWGCDPGEFCYFKHYDANPANGGWGRGFGSSFNSFNNIGAQGYGDQTSAIWNRSSKTVSGYDWFPFSECFKLIWESGPGNWGNLAPEDNDKTDAIGVGPHTVWPRKCL